MDTHSFCLSRNSIAYTVSQLLHSEKKKNYLNLAMLDTLAIMVWKQLLSLKPSETTSCSVCAKHGILSHSSPSNVSPSGSGISNELSSNVPSVISSWSLPSSTSTSLSSSDSPADSWKYDSKPGTISEPNAFMLLLALSVTNRTIFPSILYSAVIDSYSLSNFTPVWLPESHYIHVTK